jgi:hypothetical protein
MSIAVVAGFGISALLFHLSYMTGSYVLMSFQLIGFFVCMFLRGVHSATKTDYAMIAIPVNAVIYSAVVLILLRFFWRDETN